MPSTAKNILEWYNAHYNNATYKTLRTALESVPAISDKFVIDTMNLLTDAALSLSGDPQYAAAENALMKRLNELDGHLIELARQHLDQFRRNAPAAANGLKNDFNLG